VAQHATDMTPPTFNSNQFAAATPEDKFWIANASTCQYGRVAASLIFEEELGS
jgi:hypothetical protein